MSGKRFVHWNTIPVLKLDTVIGLSNIEPLISRHFMAVSGKPDPFRTST
jgi:hypothetical protein